jgi:transcriptional regulator with XRE-family HTH domain
MEIAHRLRAERERLGMSQAALAALGNVSRRTQANYEAGERQPDAAYLAASAGGGVDVLFVLTGIRAGEVAFSDVNLRSDSDQRMDVSFDAQLGQRLRAERERLGLSQQKAADGVGVRREMWSRYESGTEPGAAVLAAAGRLGFDLPYVLMGDQSARSQQSLKDTPAGTPPDAVGSQPARLAPVTHLRPDRATVEDEGQASTAAGTIDLDLMRRVESFVDRIEAKLGTFEEGDRVEAVVRIYNYLVQDAPSVAEISDQKIDRVVRLACRR